MLIGVVVNYLLQYRWTSRRSGTCGMSSVAFVGCALIG